MSINQSTKGQRPLTSRNIQYTIIIVQYNVYNVDKNHASEKAIYKLRIHLGGVLYIVSKRDKTNDTHLSGLFTEAVST